VNQLPPHLKPFQAEDLGWPAVERAVLAFAQPFAQKSESNDDAYQPISEKTA